MSPSTGGRRIDAEFEGLLAQLVVKSDEMLGSHNRLRELIAVNNDLTSNLDLATVLRRIVEIGTELIGAEYGAIGVISDDQRLEEFITVGFDDDTVRRIGHLPEGKGLLGVLIADPVPVRLASLSDDPRSSGFPENHPPMQSFLGVPISVRGAVYGNLYLTNSRHAEFSLDDEEMAQALAATAGIAITNARLFEDSVYREGWASALADTARRLIKDEDQEHLGYLVDRVKELSDADLVTIALVTSAGDELEIDRASGACAADLVAMSVPLDDAVAGEAIRTGEPVVVAALHERVDLMFPDQEQFGHALVIPFMVSGHQAGVLSLVRLRGRRSFDPRDLDMGISFANHISVAIERAEGRNIRRRVTLLEDRSRIARDLHDHVIQRLFATGLSLQAAAAGMPPDSALRVTDQIREIDAAIAQIRQSIFALHRDTEVTAVSLRARVFEIVDRLEDELLPKPRVTFLGPVDLMADAALTDDVTAVVSEALANVVRHAHATKVEVTISAAAGVVTVNVVDDGVGPGTDSRRSGLENLGERASTHHGSFTVSEAYGGGTQLVWSVPV